MKIPFTKMMLTGCLLISLTISTPIQAENQPSVGRLSYMKGAVSLLPASEEQWVEPIQNRPLGLGDSIWTDTNGQMELDLGLARMMLNYQTSLKILTLDSNIGQFQLGTGSIVLVVDKRHENRSYEIDTPNLALTLNKPGYYRVDVSNDETRVTLRSGSAGIFGETAEQSMEAGTSCVFKGSNLENSQCQNILPEDAFDNFCMNRLKETETADTQYTAPSVIGYEDLQRYGRWDQSQDYGNIWYPENVGSDWAPYRDGQWIWMASFGWTWIDANPWGFAPFHYGRWVLIDNRWGWIPGPVTVYAVYAPALVVFVNTGPNDIAWFPLGPHEIYVPPYTNNAWYFRQINISNTIINKGLFGKNFHYGHHYNDFHFKDLSIKKGLTAVPKNHFLQGNPIKGSNIKLSKDQLLNAKQNLTPPVPDNKAVLGGKTLDVRPPKGIENKPVLIKNPVKAVPLPFSEEKKLLEKNPAKPLNVETKAIPKTGNEDKFIPVRGGKPEIIQPGPKKPEKILAPQPESLGKEKLITPKQKPGPLHPLTKPEKPVMQKPIETPKPEKFESPAIEPEPSLQTPKTKPAEPLAPANKPNIQEQKPKKLHQEYPVQKPVKPQELNVNVPTQQSPKIMTPENQGAPPAVQKQKNMIIPGNQGNPAPIQKQEEIVVPKHQGIPAAVQKQKEIVIPGNQGAPVMKKQENFNPPVQKLELPDSPGHMKKP